MISSRLRVRDCEYIKQKMLGRIQSWTTKSLSYAGRVQLAISVMHGIHTYWASIFIIPKQILKEVDDVIRKFVWTGTEMKKTGAKVAWFEVCSPKKEGGLGIRSAVEWNKASMMRHLWDIARKKDSLWVKWRHVYMLKGRSLWGVDCAYNASWTWRKLLKLRNIAIKCIKYKVGNGRNVFVWYDNWHDLDPLKLKFGQRLLYDAASCDDARLAEYIIDNRWNMPAPISNALAQIRCHMPNYLPYLEREGGLG